MNDGWFYWKSGKQQGPISLQALREAIGSGILRSSDEVWRQGTPDWVPLHRVQEVADLLSSGPTPTSAWSPAPMVEQAATPVQTVADAPAWSPAPNVQTQKEPYSTASSATVPFSLQIDEPGSPSAQQTQKPTESYREVSKPSAPEPSYSGSADGTHLLNRAARADLYRVNAFRVTDLPVDATDRELTRKLDQLKMLEKLGGVPSSTGGIALSLFGPKPGTSTAASQPPSLEAIREATERLRDPETRLVDEFFWFWPSRFGDSRGDSGLVALGSGADQALAVWETQSGPDSSVARHNLAVLNHALALELGEAGSTLTVERAEARERHWDLAMRHWRSLIDDDVFWDKLTERIRDLNEPQLPPRTARHMRIGLPRMLLSINAQLAVHAAQNGLGSEAARLLGYVDRSGFDPGDIHEVLRDAVEPLRERIRMLCQTATQEANQEPEKGDQAARRLYEQGRPVLTILQQLLPAANVLRQDAGDDLAMGILACQVRFGQKTNDWDKSLELVRLALPLAGSESGRVRLEQEVEIVQQTLKTWEDYRKLAMCWFCQKEPGDPLANFDVPMYGNITTQWFGNSYQLRWQYVHLKVPRCPVCRKAHRKREWRTLSFAGLGGLIGLGGHLLVHLLTGSWFPGLFLISGGLLAGGIWADRTSHRANKRLGIKPVSEKKKHPEVLRLKGEGWQFGTKPPGGR